MSVKSSSVVVPKILLAKVILENILKVTPVAFGVAKLRRIAFEEGGRSYFFNLSDSPPSFLWGGFNSRARRPPASFSIFKLATKQFVFSVSRKRKEGRSYFFNLSDSPPSFSVGEVSTPAPEDHLLLFRFLNLPRNSLSSLSVEEFFAFYKYIPPGKKIYADFLAENRNNFIEEIEYRFRLNVKWIVPSPLENATESLEKTKIENI
ncbi:hypothetical protein CEXT_662551 [Caerostris extrusa]|uniref:Uncharacterized protein n=1 Tax=Caerostris extrusa TaxID=172846 RepID=A0AAV4VC42_CAEEX|nr:hypothetical protein CEXT_662551 [Caerostris extrusa]